MIYGYKLAEVNEHGLVELKEVTFATDADTLRDLGRFLTLMAEAMDGDEFHHTHMHIGNVIEGWSRRHDKDVIVTTPVESED